MLRRRGTKHRPPAGSPRRKISAKCPNSHPDIASCGNSPCRPAVSGRIHRMDRAHATIDWDAAWREHSRWLRTVIVARVGEVQAVDDVLQQVGLAVAQAKRRPIERDQVAPWLYRVAARQCLMHRRSAGRRRKLLRRIVSEGTLLSEHQEESPLDWLLLLERREAARQALSELPEIDRQMLLLKHTENWTYQQLAEHLGVSVHSVEHRLLRARHRLREQVLKREIVEAAT